MTDVIAFPKPKRPPPPDGQTLVPVHTKPCSHFGGPFLVDESAAEVECGQCHAKLSPMWVLAQLSNKETNFMRNAQASREASKQLEERSRTKCQHCGAMTRISRT